MNLDLQLHIYEGRNVVKTYACNVIDLELGLIEDVAHVFQMDSIRSGNKVEIAAVIVKCIDQVRPFLCDMFDGLTMEEARHTRTQNLVSVFSGLFAWITYEMNNAANEDKKK